MAISGSIIQAPVGLMEVYEVLGWYIASGSYYDLGQACKSAKVNKWSKWKPVRYASLTSPTCAEMIAMHMGIDVSGAKNALLKTAINNWGASASTYTAPTPDEVKASMGDYAYLQPTGGSSSPYRLTDFCADKDTLSSPFPRQYDHDSKAPDSWRNWQLSKEELQRYAGYYLTRGEFTTGDTSWTMDTDKTAVYQDCNVRVSPSSGETIGDTSSNTMPLTYIFGNGTDVTDKWRLGLAIYLPYGTDTNSNPCWGVMCGTDILMNGYSNNGVVLPLPATNLRLMRALWYNYNVQRVSVFNVIPVILQNCTIDYGTLNSADQCVPFISLFDSFNASVLTTPSKAAITLTITDNDMERTFKADTDFRYVYYSPVNGGKTYKIVKGVTVSSGSGYTFSWDYYRVTIPSGLVGIIEYDGTSSNGHLKSTVTSGDGSTLCTVQTYANQTDMDNGVNPTSTAQVPFTNTLVYFMNYMSTDAPYSLTLQLTVNEV